MYQVGGGKMISISFELPRQLHAQPQELPKDQEGVGKGEIFSVQG